MSVIKLRLLNTLIKKKRKNILKLEAKNNYRSYHTSIHLIPIPALLLIASIFKSI